MHTKRLWIMLIGLVLLLAGCNLPAAPPPDVPTSAALPTTSPTSIAIATLPPTWTPTYTFTPSATPTITPTFTPSATPTATASDTPIPTATSTASTTPTPTSSPIPSPTELPFQGVVTDHQPAAPPDATGIEARLWAVPVLPRISGQARQIFAAGQALGNRANVFSKVGDCHTAGHFFMLPLGVGEYNLGQYGYLQTTIDFFSASPRQGVANSFVNESMAASTAFNAGAVLDSIWANPTHCQDGESPLACEYRIVQPAVAIILVGSVDTQIYPAETFRMYLRQVVQTTIDAGIVPVLTTFPTSPDYYPEEALAFNAVILDVAAEGQLPLINFWRAARDLPNYGLSEDGFHLSQREERAILFTGDEWQWGMTLRNLITLEALEVLRRGLLT